VQLNLVRGAHWLDDICATAGIPRLYVLLEEVAMNRIKHEDVPDFGAHVSKLLYVNEVMSRAETQGDWVGSELTDFGKSDTGRHPITWDTQPYRG
jgi:hypothetical protein